MRRRAEVAGHGPRAERCARLLRRIPGTVENAGQGEREARVWALGQAALAAEEAESLRYAPWAVESSSAHSIGTCSTIVIMYAIIALVEHVL